MGGKAAVVRWERGHVRTVVSGSGAMAGGGGESSAFEGDGAGDDVFHAAGFFLFGRRGRWILAGLDLPEHRSGHSQAQKPSGRADIRGSERELETESRTSASVFAARRIA